MCSSGRKFFSVTLFIVHLCSSFLVSYCDENASQASKEEKLFSSNSLSEKTLFDEDPASSDDGQESTNFFTSDLGAPFDSSSDYGSLFDNFPGLPYFPDFGEIFRVTTPRPPFSFPDYVRESFPESRSRRFPRPASSGTRTKVSKQNQSGEEPKEKPLKSSKQPPSKSKDFPKIFRFTSDRVNLADFDTKKKMNENYLTLHKGDELDSDKVKRNKFLILHGGVFEIERNGRLSLISQN